MPRSTITTRILDFGVVVGLVAIAAALVHFWVADRRALSRAVYPFQAQLSVWSIVCSHDAPPWMAQQLRQVTRSGGSPANQLAFAAPDGSMHFCSNGWTGTPLLSPPVTERTRFRYASLTKLITADAILDLVSQGKLRLDDRLTHFFPDLPDLRDSRVAEITIDHLLRHQGGFDRLKSEDVMFKHKHKPWCPYDVHALANIRLDFAPGDRYSYSNRGYCLLGEILERATDAPYRDYIKQRYALGDLGVSFIDGPYLDDEVRYDFRNTRHYGNDYHKLFDFHALSPVASLSGSARALAQLVQTSLLRGNYNLMSADVPRECGVDRHEDCFGFGVYPYSQAGLSPVYLHLGLLPGAASVLMIDESKGVSVLLTSGQSGQAQERKIVESMYRARCCSPGGATIK